MTDLKSKRPDFEQFLKVLWRKGEPTHLPFYEHIASPGFIAERMGVPVENLTWSNPEYPRIHNDFWIGMGYDCVPMEIVPNCPTPTPEPSGGASIESEAFACIFTMDDLESHPWPDPSAPMNFEPFERAAAVLTEGAKIVGGVCAGPFEWATKLMGYQGLSLAQATAPDLFRAIFEKIGEMHTSALRHLAGLDYIGALRQGDDLGFKTSTFLSPDVLREHVLPIYKQMAQIAHDAGKPFILHSCGNLADVYDDLIDECKIDAKHSFEDQILPVGDFKKAYGDRVGVLGGLDVDFICRGSEEAIRAYTRKTIEACFADGYYALGTGNSLTDYMPVEHYMWALDEGMKVAG